MLIIIIGLARIAAGVPDTVEPTTLEKQARPRRLFPFLSLTRAFSNCQFYYFRVVKWTTHALAALLIFSTVVYARDPAQVRAFRKSFPCPSTGKTTGACQGWVVDHVVPLCWGGKDIPANMQWQEVRQSYLKDRFEREACAMKKKYSAATGELGFIEEAAPTPCWLTYAGCG